MDDQTNGIILYHYSFSPYARRVIWYLALAWIDFAQCVRGAHSICVLLADPSIDEPQPVQLLFSLARRESVRHKVPAPFL